MTTIRNNDNNLHVYHARNYDSAGEVEFNGGTTLAFYVQPNERGTVLMYGLARCHEKDGFNRKTGRDLAIIRLTESPTILVTDFPGKFLVSKALEINSQGVTTVANYRLPSSKVILTMFANIIIEHYAQELQNKAFSMYESDMYDDVDASLEGEQIIDEEHATEVLHSNKTFVPSLGNGVSDHDVI